MKDSNARVTVFAPVDDVFTYNPTIRAMDQKETLSHIGKTHKQLFSRVTKKYGNRSRRDRKTNFETSKL